MRLNSRKSIKQNSEKDYKKIREKVGKSGRGRLYDKKIIKKRRVERKMKHNKLKVN